MLWTSIQILFALPPLTAALIMVLLDRNLGAHFFDPQRHGSAILFQHMFWFFGHPEVYILILPAFGMISEIVPVFSRKVLFGYEFMAAATAAIVFISLGVWVHHMFTVGLGRFEVLFFIASSLLVSVPTGIKMFNWLATIYGGKIYFASPMLYAFGFLSMFVIGGLTGIMLAAAPFDFQLNDSYFVVGHFHWVLIGGTVFGVLGGIHYWYPKVTGRMLSERLAKWQFWLLYIGFFITFGGMHVSGLLGMPAPHLYLPCRSRLDDLESDNHDRRRDAGGEYFDVGDQPGVVVSARQAGRRRSLERLDIGMVDHVAATGIQLRNNPGGPQPPPALGFETPRRPGLEIRMREAKKGTGSSARIALPLGACPLFHRGGAKTVFRQINRTFIGGRE